jgi:hypothetical protein
MSCWIRSAACARLASEAALPAAKGVCQSEQATNVPLRRMRLTCRNVRGFSQQQTRLRIPIATPVCSVSSSRQNFDLQPICPSAPPCVSFSAARSVGVDFNGAAQVPPAAKGLFWVALQGPPSPRAPQSIRGMWNRATTFPAARIAQRHDSGVRIPETWRALVVRRVRVFAAGATRVAPAPEYDRGLLSTSKTSPEATRHGLCVIIVLPFLGVGFFSSIFCHCLPTS